MEEGDRVVIVDVAADKVFQSIDKPLGAGTRTWDLDDAGRVRAVRTVTTIPAVAPARVQFWRSSAGEPALRVIDGVAQPGCGPWTNARCMAFTSEWGASSRGLGGRRLPAHTIMRRPSTTSVTVTSSRCWERIGVRALWGRSPMDGSWWCLSPSLAGWCPYSQDRDRGSGPSSSRPSPTSSSWENDRPARSCWASTATGRVSESRSSISTVELSNRRSRVCTVRGHPGSAPWEDLERGCSSQGRHPAGTATPSWNSTGRQAPGAWSSLDMHIARATDDYLSLRAASPYAAFTSAAPCSRSRRLRPKW